MRGAVTPFRFRLIAALFLVLLWAACSDQVSGPAAPAVTQLEIERRLPSALRLQGGFTNELLALPGVVGTTVAALVEHGGVRVPPGVRVIVTGTFSALDWQAVPQGQPCGKGKQPACETPEDPPEEPASERLPSERFDRPVPIGVSTGHPAITAGTIGARVTRLVSGLQEPQVFALSNNHVYAASNFLDCDPTDEYDCKLGDLVIQPGTYDGGTLDANPADDIGTLADFEPLKMFGACSTIDTNDVKLVNIMDAAIALSSTDDLGNATPMAGYGTPESTTMAAALNMKVK